MKNNNSSNPFWGAGESKDFGKVAIEYAAGKDIYLDSLFVQYECLVNEAHQIMLWKAGILQKNQVKKIVSILEEIRKLDLEGKFFLKKELEDVHSNVEKYVTDKLGIEIGGNLRLGIARNDQIYTDTRMFLRTKLISIIRLITNLINDLVNVAGANTNTIMPGYTHLRISQPITYSHWLTAKCYHFLDDAENIYYDLDQVNQCPLGIFEFAGTQLPVDRDMTAHLLGFKSILRNSLYAANTRGELEIKVLADFSLLAIHIKRTMQELILWSTHEFGLIEIDDLYTTGGTAQPNLKNPDTLEVVRANSSKIYSKLYEMISTMDFLTSGYNRDTQQTKSAIIEAVDVIESTLPVVTGIMTTLKLNKERMEKLANVNFASAPDLSNQIAVKGRISFREAYQIIKYIIKNKYISKSLSEITPKMIDKVADNLLHKSVKVTQQDIDLVATAKQRIVSVKSSGGPQPYEVKNMIKEITKKNYLLRKKIIKTDNFIQNSLKELEKEVHFLIIN